MPQTVHRDTAARFPNFALNDLWAGRDVEWAVRSIGKSLATSFKE